MRAVFFGLALVVAACAPAIRSDLPDSGFQVVTYFEPDTELECFESIGVALTPLVERLKVDARGERGVDEFRVTRRGQQVFVIDALKWDSDHDRSYFFHERQIFEREDTPGAQWCRTRVLSRPTRNP